MARERDAICTSTSLNITKLGGDKTAQVHRADLGISGKAERIHQPWKYRTGRQRSYTCSGNVAIALISIEVVDTAQFQVLGNGELAFKDADMQVFLSADIL